MPNDELKKRIKEILRKRMAELLGSCHTDEVPFDEKSAAAIMFYADEFADALIAAGIGDVAEEKNLRESAESFYMKKCKECSSISKELRQSERHIADVERALKRFAENISCEDCPFFSDCSSSEKMKDFIHSDYCFAEYLRQAEKELAEARKDD